MRTIKGRGLFSDVYGRPDAHLGDSNTNLIVSGLRRAIYQLHNARGRYQGASCNKTNYFYDILNTINRLDGEFKKFDNIVIQPYDWKNVQPCRKRDERDSNYNIDFINQATTALLSLISIVKEEIYNNSEANQKNKCQKICHAANKVVALEDKLYNLLKRVDDFKVKLLVQTRCLNGYGFTSNNNSGPEPFDWVNKNTRNNFTRRSNPFPRTRCQSCNISGAENELGIKCEYTKRDHKSGVLKQTHSLQPNYHCKHKVIQNYCDNTTKGNCNMQRSGMLAREQAKPFDGLTLKREYTEFINKYNNTYIAENDRNVEVLAKRRVRFDDIKCEINKHNNHNVSNSSDEVVINKVRNRAGKDSPGRIRPPRNTIYIRRVDSKNKERSGKEKKTAKRKRNRRRPNRSRQSSESMINEKESRKNNNKEFQARKRSKAKPKYNNYPQDKIRGARYVRETPSKFSVRSSSNSNNENRRKIPKKSVRETPSKFSVRSSSKSNNENRRKIPKKSRKDDPNYFNVYPSRSRKDKNTNKLKIGARSRSPRKGRKYASQKSEPEHIQFHYKNNPIINKKHYKIFKEDSHCNKLIDSFEYISSLPSNLLDNYYELSPSYEQDILPNTDACRFIDEENYTNQTCPIRRCFDPNIYCYNRNDESRIYSQECDDEVYFPRGCGISQYTCCPRKSENKQSFTEYILVETSPSTKKQKRIKNERFVVVKKPSKQYTYSSFEYQKPKVSIKRKKYVYKKERQNNYKSKYIFAKESSTTLSDDSSVEDNRQSYSNTNRIRSTSKINRKSKRSSIVMLNEREESSSTQTDDSYVEENRQSYSNTNRIRSTSQSIKQSKRSSRVMLKEQDETFSFISSSSTSSYEDEMRSDHEATHTYSGRRIERHESKKSIKSATKRSTSNINNYEVANTSQREYRRKYRRSQRKSRETLHQYASPSSSEETITERPEMATKRTSTTEIIRPIKTIGTNTSSIVVKEPPKPTVYSKKTSMSELMIPTKAMATNTIITTTKDSGIDPMPEKKIIPVDKINQYTITDKMRVRSFGTDAVPEKPKLKMTDTATDPHYHIIQLSKDTNTVPEVKRGMHDTGTDPNPILKIDQKSIGNDPIYVGHEVKETNTTALLTKNAETETLPKPEGIGKGTDPVRIETKERQTSYDKVKTFNRETDPIKIIQFDKGQQFDTVKINPKMVSVFTRTDDKTTDYKFTQTSFIKETPKKITTTDINTQTSNLNIAERCPSISRKKTKVIVDPPETPSESSCLSVHLLFEKCQEEIYRRRSQMCKSKCLDRSKSNKPIIICEKKRCNTTRITNDEFGAKENTNTTPQQVDVDISLEANDISQLRERERVISDGEIKKGYLDKYSKTKRPGNTRFSMQCGVDGDKKRSKQNFHVSQIGTYNEKTYHGRSGVEDNLNDKYITSSACDWTDIAKKVKEDHKEK